MLRKLLNPGLFMGPLFICVGLVILNSMMPEMEDKQKTTATLVDYIEYYDRDEGSSWSGIYEFEADGETYEIESSISSGSRVMIKKSVTIEYDKVNPDINAIPSERYFPIAFIALGSLATIASISTVIKVSKVEGKADYIDDKEIFKEL